MKPLILACPTRHEMSALLRHFKLAPQLPQEGGAAAGKLAGREFTLAVLGIGPVNAAYEAGVLLARKHEYGGMILAGVAGSLAPNKARIGDLFKIQEEIWPEYGLIKGDAIDPRGLGIAQAKGPGGAVFRRIVLDPDQTAPSMGLDVFGLPAASSLTVAGAPGDRASAASLRRFGAPLVNMEGFAGALACFKAGLPFLEIRAVSDIAGEPDRPDFKTALEALASGIASITAGRS